MLGNGELSVLRVFADGFHDAGQYPARIVRGKNYGWPFCYGDRQPDPYTQTGIIPGKVSKQEYCNATQGSLLGYTAHAAAIGMQFYTGRQFPAEYRGDAFAAFRGSWNRSEPSGYEIGRVNFDAAGKPVGISPFVTGFVYQDEGGWMQFGRVAGVAQYTDGSLLFTDDQSGVIYRVLYTGAGQTEATQTGDTQTGAGQ